MTRSIDPDPDRELHLDLELAPVPTLAPETAPANTPAPTPTQETRAGPLTCSQAPSLSCRTLVSPYRVSPSQPSAWQLPLGKQ